MKHILINALCLVFALNMHAQKQENKSLLYEISGNGLTQPSYLFGTIHMICKEDFFLPETVQAKFSNAKHVYLEMDMDDAALQMKMMKVAMLPKGESLQKIFGADYQLVDSFFQQAGPYRLSMFNQFKPMMVMSLLYMQLLPCQTPESYETRFVALAQQQKKDILGLETIEDQMQVFDNIPDSVEAANIVKMVKEYKQQQQQFSEMIEVYKQQDVERLFSFVSSSPDLMNAQEDLLTKRNSNWIPVMEKSMKDGGSFFAVGAAHLGGSIGLIELLRKAGYTVRPVQL